MDLTLMAKQLAQATLPRARTWCAIWNRRARMEDCAQRFRGSPGSKSLIATSLNMDWHGLPKAISQGSLARCVRRTDEIGVK
jgi:hypothetical protein